MARGLWAAGVAVLLAWGCGGREDVPVRVEAPTPGTPGPVVSEPLPPLPEVEAPRQQFQWLRRVTGEQRYQGQSVAFAPDGSTVLLSTFDLPRASPEDRRYTSLQLDAWTPEGAPRWSRRAPNFAPDDYDWVYELRSTSTGFLVLDNPLPGAGHATGIDLGCGALERNRLLRMDAEGRCLHQTAFQGEATALAVDGADDAYLTAEVKGWSLPYVRLDARGQRVFERPPTTLYDSLWLGWSEAEGLVGIRTLGEGGQELVWLSPEFQPLRSREAPTHLGAPTTVSPEGRIVTRMRQGERVLPWGARELPAGSKDMVLVIEADGAPGAAIVLDSPFNGRFQVTADEHGLVIAGLSTVGQYPGPMTHSIELLAYGWDGALQRRQVVAEVSTPACGGERDGTDSACRATLGVSSLTVHPRHGIRLAGGVQGPAKFIAAGEGVEAGAAQSFVMAFRR